MKVSIQLVGLLALGVLCSSPAAEAQFLPAPTVTTNPRLHLGPFDLTPTVSLSNVGIDTNLFNEAEASDPQRDVAMTFAPQTDIAAHMGRGWLIGSVRQDWLWFRQYRDQRSANGLYRGSWYVPLNRVTWLVEGSYLRSRERPNAEIDLRADRRERGGTVTTEVRAWPRTLLGGRIEHRDVKFRERELFGGQNLGEELDRARISGTASIRYELTPLTSVAFEASAFDEQFVAASWRSAKSTQFAAGLRFDPSAFVKGHVLVGYREFALKSDTVPAYAGATFAMNLNSIVGTSTRLAFEGVRDVEYSFDPERPYYVLSGASGSVTRRLFGPVDVQARLGWRSLAYQTRTDIVVEHARRRDRVVTIAESLGYRLGASTRVTFDIESQRRTSPLTLRNYRGARYGLSLIWTPAGR